MTGVYMHALGERADELHPKVRDRYDIDQHDDVAVVGRGEMDITRGTVALPALYAMTTRDLLFPEQGEDVPFTVTTVGYVDGAGREMMTTRREFRFDGTRRRFDSLTVWERDNRRLLDVLGRGGHIVSELHPRVEDGALVVEGGRQWLRTGSRYLPMPGPMAASVEVRDRYDEDDDLFHVTATVENPLVGSILEYRGTFDGETEPMTDVPDDLRPTRIGLLPPA